MDSFELNKIIGAILGTLLFVMGVGFLAEAIYEPAEGNGPGYNLPAAPEDTGDTNTPPAAVVDIGTLLASADPKAGADAAKKCTACHDFTEGGPNKTGPNLYDVVGRQIASHPGFSYSASLSEHNKDKWTYELLDQWLLSPKSFASGTKMSYGGDKDDSDRANIIAFLSTLSKSPVPFPAPAAPQGGPAPTPEQTVDGTSSVSPSDETQTAPASSAPAASSSSAAPAPSSSVAPASSSAPPAPSSSAAAASSSSVAPAPSSSAAPAPVSSSAPTPTSSEASASSAAPAPLLSAAPAPLSSAAPAPVSSAAPAPVSSAPPNSSAPPAPSASSSSVAP